MQTEQATKQNENQSNYDKNEIVQKRMLFDGF